MSEGPNKKACDEIDCLEQVVLTKPATIYTAWGNNSNQLISNALWVCTGRRDQNPGMELTWWWPYRRL